MLLQKFLLIWGIWDLVHVCHHEGSLGHLLPRTPLTTTLNFHSDLVSESFQVCHLFSQLQLSLSGGHPAWFSLHLRILFWSQASKKFGRQWSRGLLENVSANDPFWFLVLKSRPDDMAASTASCTCFYDAWISNNCHWPFPLPSRERVSSLISLKKNIPFPPPHSWPCRTQGHRNCVSHSPFPDQGWHSFKFYSDKSDLVPPQIVSKSIPKKNILHLHHPPQVLKGLLLLLLLESLSFWPCLGDIPDHRGCYLSF